MSYLISITKYPKQSVHVSQFYVNHLNHLNVWLVSYEGPLVLELRTLPLSYLELWSGHKVFPPLFVSSWRKFKDYVHYKKFLKMSYLRHKLRIFLFRGKAMFRSQDIQVFVFLTILWFTKSVKSWWVLVHEIGHILEYIFWTTTH